jgi:hypothetical protein
MAPLEDTVRQLQKDVRTLNDATVEHRVRLENGSRVFAQQREVVARVDSRVDKVEEQIRPRPPSMLKVIAVTFGVFVTLAGALWYLSERLADRPTTDQLRNVVSDHEKAGHPQTQAKLGDLRIEMGEQRALIKDVREDQGEIREAQDASSRKLDTLLKRVRR